MANFQLEEEDFYAIQIAMNAARHLLTLPMINSQQVIGLGHAMLALQRLPNDTPGIFVEYGVELRKGSKNFRESRYIDFIISEERFEISIGGSTVDNQSGGDSYSEPGWIIETGGYYNRKCLLYQIEDEIYELLGLGAKINVEDESVLESD